MGRFLRSAGVVVARLALLALALGALVGIYAVIARPWLHNWGATDAERVARLPGDEIVPAARSQETRAIGIDAPAPYVWAWVSQLGQDRAGFYSYQVLENVVGCEMPNVQRVVPRLSHWRVGDKLWMYPPRKAGGIGYATLVVLEPGHALGFATRQIGAQPLHPPDASWSFIVQPAGEHATRLIFRGRGAGGLRVAPAVLTHAAFEPMHFAMERRTMTSIKELAEGRTPSPQWDALQVILWAAVLSAFLASGVATVVGRRPWRPLAGFFLLGLLFMLLTLVQPHPLVGAALLLAVAVLPGWRHAVGPKRNVRAPRAGSVQILRG
jgi:hypothetical protein